MINYNKLTSIVLLTSNCLNNNKQNVINNKNNNNNKYHHQQQQQQKPSSVIKEINDLSFVFTVERKVKKKRIKKNGKEQLHNIQPSTKYPLVCS